MKKNVHGNRFHAVAADGAVDWDHPLNRGRVFWGLVPPGVPAAGSRLVNLCNRNPRADGTLTPNGLSGCLWTPTPNYGSALAFARGRVDYITSPGQYQTPPVSVAAWVRVDALPSDAGAIATNGVNSWYLRVTTTGALEWLQNNVGGNFDTGSTVLSVGAWSRCGFSMSAAGDVTIYVNGQPVASATGKSSSGTDVFLIGGGNNNGCENLTGLIADPTVIQRVWTPQEFAYEYQLSQVGYQTPDSPLRWFSTRTYFIPSGGTANTQTNTGSCTPSGALTKAVTRALAGSSSGAGALAKAASKPLAGSCTASGGLAKITAKPLAGSSTGAGAVTKTCAKPVAGSTAATGALAKAASKTLAGTGTPSGGLRKAVAKTLAGGSTPSGALVVGRAVLQALAGACTAAGAIVKACAKHAAGSVAGAGVLAKSGAKSLAGSSTPAGALVKGAAKNPGGSVAPFGALAVGRAVLKTFTGTVAGAGSLVKSAAKSLLGFVAGSGALTTSGGSAPPPPQAGGRRFTIFGRGGGASGATGRGSAGQSAEGRGSAGRGTTGDDGEGPT